MFLVEGESDCHVLWSWGLPALGVPGVDSWRSGWVGYLDSLRVLVVRERDQAGAKFARRVSEDVLRARVVDPPGAWKDVADAHVGGVPLDGWARSLFDTNHEVGEVPGTPPAVGPVGAGQDPGTWGREVSNRGEQFDTSDVAGRPRAAPKAAKGSGPAEPHTEELHPDPSPRMNVLEEVPDESGTRPSEKRDKGEPSIGAALVTCAPFLAQGATKYDLAEALGIHEDAAKKRLQRWEKAGWVEVVSEGKGRGDCTLYEGSLRLWAGLRDLDTSC